jgi:hypothetical protein
VEAKFVRDKAATFPLEPVDPSQPLMVAPDGSGRASVNLYSRGRDQLWGEEIRGIAPAPNASTEGAETEVRSVTALILTDHRGSVIFDPKQLRLPNK